MSGLSRRGGRIVLALAAVLGLVVPVLAGPIDDFIAAANAAKTSPDPINSFFGSFAAFPDMTLTGAEIRDGLARAGIPMDNPAVAQMLGNIQSFSKRGDRVEVRNQKKQGTNIVADGKSKGWVTLGQTVKIRIRRQGNEVVIDEFEGIELSKERDSFRVGLRKVRFLEEQGKPKAKVTAGWGPFSKTVDVDLSDPAKVDPERAASSPGITGNVPN